MSHQENVVTVPTINEPEPDEHEPEEIVIETDSITGVMSESGSDNQTANQVDLRLNTNLLNVHLQARPASARMSELNGRVEVLTNLLDQTNLRLEESFRRIGYLEAQLELAQNKSISHDQ